MDRSDNTEIDPSRTSLSFEGVHQQLDDEALSELAVQCGFHPDTHRLDGSKTITTIDVTVHWTQTQDVTYDKAHRRSTDEAYFLEIPASIQDAVQMRVSSRRSLRWALIDLKGRLETWRPGLFFDAPAFSTRGILEGFYGPPWTSEARLEMVDFAARNRLNTIMYGPKDDPYLRTQWRTPHDGPSLARLGEFIERCTNRDIDAMVGVSPGLSMRYASDEDYELLVAKVDSLVSQGAHRVALLLDDIPSDLQHPQDVQRFGSLAEAQIQVANRLRDHLAPVPLTVCPTQYHGAGDEAYLCQLGAGLDPRISLFWTGRAICSPEITAGEAAVFTRSANRKPLYWDNYPVNDVAMTNEMHIGPFSRRDPLLHHFSDGIMANAMEYPEASKISLATVADYLWNPEDYDEEASWRSAISQVVGQHDAQAFAAFADNCRQSCLSEPDPLVLSSAVEQFGFDVRYADPAEAKGRLRDVAKAMQAAVTHLLSSTVTNKALLAEVGPWLHKFALGAEAVAAIADIWPLSGQTISAASRQRLSQFRSDLDSSPVQVFGNIIEMTLDELIQGKEPVI